MRKIILLPIMALLSLNLSMAQFICSISPKVKEAGVVMTKDKGNSKDASIVGDYREQGTGWILLPDHTGAVFIKNIQVNELIWGLDNNNGNLALAVLVLKNGLDDNGKLIPESQNLFLVNIKSDTAIELLNTQTSLTLKQKRTKLIAGKEYSKIREIEEKQKKAKEPFSVFAKRYVDTQIDAWQKKGDYEKTTDWQARVTDENRKQKIADLMDEAVEKYADWVMNNVIGESYSQHYFYSGESSGKYDADKEIYLLNVSYLGSIPIKVPVDEAKYFDNALKSRSIMDDIHPSDMIYFIQNDELALAEATFEVPITIGESKSYKYINPDAKNRKKTKKEIERENKQQAKEQLIQAENYYSNKDYKKAIACYQKVISLNPDIMVARNYKALGNAYFLTEDYSQVIISFKKALALDLNEVEDENVYYHLGVAYHKLKDYSNAIDAYNKSFRFMYDMRSRAVIYNLIGQAYYESKDFTKSIKAYQQLLEFSNEQDKAIIYNNMGAAYNGQGDYLSAIKILESAIEIDSKMARSYYNLGNAYKGDGNQKKAIKAYKKAANLGDKDAQSTLKEQGIEW